MAQAGYTPIIMYHSTTGSAVPLAADLAPGELGLNINDMKLYCENSSGTVTLLAASVTPPANGGTGVINGTNNTITFTGNYTLGLTLTANTSVTLPTSGSITNTGKAIAMAMIFGF